MWGNADATRHVLVGTRGLDPGLQMLDGDRGLVLGGTEHLLVGHAAQAEAGHGFQSRSNVHDFAQRCDAAAEAFHDSQACGQGEIFPLERFVLGPGQLSQPGQKRDVFQKAPEQGELQMDVGVDETGHEDGVFERDRIRAFRYRIGHGHDAIAVYDEDPVPDGGSRHGTDPVCGESLQDVNVRSVSVRRSMRSRRTV
jgi:hypothetical protein